MRCHDGGFAAANLPSLGQSGEAASDAELEAMLSALA